MSALIRESVRQMTAYTPGEQPESADVIKLNTNENPYPPSARVTAALAGLNPDALRRYPNPVSSRLRERLAELHRCGPGNVFVGNGSDEVLALCTRAFVENDGSVGYFVPSYSLYPVLTDIRAVEKRPVALDQRFEWVMPEGYECDLFFLTNPNAPTGMLFPRDKVSTFCAAARGVVVIDEAYVDFAREDCVDIALNSRNVLVSRTMSKSYSLAGLRLGYAVGPAELIEALHKIKDSYNVDAVTQAVALAAVEDVATMRANVGRVVATRKRLAARLEQLGYEVFPSDANFVWARPAGIASGELYERLRDDNIFVRYFPGDTTGEFVRITVGTDEQVDVLLSWIERA